MKAFGGQCGTGMAMGMRHRDVPFWRNVGVGVGVCVMMHARGGGRLASKHREAGTGEGEITGPAASAAASRPSLTLTPGREP